MNIHEYQAKNILSEKGILIQRGIVSETPNDALEAASALQRDFGTNKWVVKAQIHSGGRGKAGGVQLAETIDEVLPISEAILGKRIVTAQTGDKGKLVRKILVAEDVYPTNQDVKEIYLAFLLNRNTGHTMFLYSSGGGVEVEAQEHNSIDIHPLLGWQDFQLREVCKKLEKTKEKAVIFSVLLKKLYEVYCENDAVLLEINPLLENEKGDFIVVDVKMSLDDNAKIRNIHWDKWRDVYEEEPIELAAKDVGLNYIKLSGNVGCMVNGAGLAMATMDMILRIGGHPANFLDIGGGANSDRVSTAFRMILEDKEVKTIFINIFGGIVRCDRVAEGILKAYREIKNISIPIVVRLQGTNADIAHQLIASSGLQVYSVNTLEEASNKIQQIISC